MDERDPRRERGAGRDPMPRTALHRPAETEEAEGTRGSSRRRDSEIRADLDARLAGADEFDPNEVDLLVQDGVVVLLGQVPDQATKRSLEQLAVGVPGVRELHDQLRVLGTTPSSTSEGARTEEPAGNSRPPRP